MRRHGAVNPPATAVFFEPGGKTAGDDGFAFEYDQGTRTITITGPKLGIGEIKTIEYTTRVSYGAAVAGSIENTAYLVPDGGTKKRGQGAALPCPRLPPCGGPNKVL